MEQQALYVNSNFLNQLNDKLASGWRVVSVTALHVSKGYELAFESNKKPNYEGGAIVIIEKHKE